MVVIEERKMKTVDSNLLIQDLYSRLPYGTIEVEYCGDNYGLVGISHGRCILCKKFSSITLDICPLVEEVKPYLFPLSENHEKEIHKICPSYGEYSFHDDIYGRGIDVEEAYEFYKYCYKNNIDFLGLISNGLAINATGLNIY